MKKDEEELFNKRKGLHDLHFERIFSHYDYAERLRNKAISALTSDLGLHTDIDKLTELTFSASKADIRKTFLEVGKELDPLKEFDEIKRNINFTGSILPPPPEPTLEEKQIAESTEKTADNTKQILDAVKSDESTKKSSPADTSVGRFRAIEASQSSITEISPNTDTSVGLFRAIEASQSAIKDQNRVLESIGKDTIIKRIRGHEGGLDKSDKRTGGTSYSGITQTYYDQWRKSKSNLPDSLPKDVKDLKGNSDLISQIYSDYLTEHFVDLMPNYMQYIYADFAFNSGKRALKTIQKILGVSRSGRLTDITKQAIAEWKSKSKNITDGDETAKKFILDFHEQKIKYYEWLVRKDPDQYAKYLKGWKSRANAVLETALEDLESGHNKKIKDIQSVTLPELPELPELPKLSPQEHKVSPTVIEPVAPKLPAVQDISQILLPELKILEKQTQAVLATLPEIELTPKLVWQGFNQTSSAVGEIPSIPQMSDTSPGRFRELESSQSEIVKDLTHKLIEPVAPKIPSVGEFQEPILSELKVLRRQTEAILSTLPEIDVSPELTWQGFNKTSSAVGGIPSVPQIPDKPDIPMPDTSVGRFREIESSQIKEVIEQIQKLIDPVIPTPPSVPDISQITLPELKISDFQTQPILADIPKIEVIAKLEWEGFDNKWGIPPTIPDDIVKTIRDTSVGRFREIESSQSNLAAASSNNPIVAAAQKYIGLKESNERDKSELMKLFKQQNITFLGKPLDPEKVAWCTAFVSAVLSETGHKSLSGKEAIQARAYAQYGEKGTGAVGDIGVWQGPKWGHTAIVVKGGEDPLTIGGNTNDQVQYRYKSKLDETKKFLGYRRPVKMRIPEKMPDMPSLPGDMAVPYTRPGIKTSQEILTSDKLAEIQEIERIIDIQKQLQGSKFNIFPDIEEKRAENKKHREETINHLNTLYQKVVKYQRDIDELSEQEFKHKYGVDSKIEAQKIANNELDRIRNAIQDEKDRSDNLEDHLDKVEEARRKKQDDLLKQEQEKQKKAFEEEKTRRKKNSELDIKQGKQRHDIFINNLEEELDALEKSGRVRTKEYYNTIDKLIEAEKYWLNFKINSLNIQLAMEASLGVLTPERIREAHIAQEALRMEIENINKKYTNREQDAVKSSIDFERDATKRFYELYKRMNVDITDSVHTRIKEIIAAGKEYTDLELERLKEEVEAYEKHQKELERIEKEKRKQFKDTYRLFVSITTDALKVYDDYLASMKDGGEGKVKGIGKLTGGLIGLGLSLTGTIPVDPLTAYTGGTQVGGDLGGILNRILGVETFHSQSNDRIAKLEARNIGERTAQDRRIRATNAKDFSENFAEGYKEGVGNNNSNNNGGYQGPKQIVVEFKVNKKTTQQLKLDMDSLVKNRRA